MEGILWFFALAATIVDTYCLECFQCTGIVNISSCHNLTSCLSDEYCYTDIIGYGDQARYSLGCRNRQTCVMSATTVSPLSIVGRSVTQDLQCSQCCGHDECNTHLCTTRTDALSTGHCEDDPNVDCVQFSSLFSICTDIKHAQQVCPKFCKLCKVVSGHWSDWNSWSICSVTCATGTMTRTRTCTNPPPSNGGLPCPDSNTDTTTCSLQPCPVHGGWSLWSPWGACSVTCGVGMERRDRYCNNPYPGPGGDHCFGDSRDDRTCFERPCANGMWSSWSSWGSCSATCLGGLSKRTRICNNPTPSAFGHDCVGNDEEAILCNSVECPVVHGGWTTWNTWSTCSANCEQIRTRTCTNPSPSMTGNMCLGSTEDKTICDIASCATAPLHVRLVGESSLSNGRLEVSLDGSEWGTVCDDLFNAGAARVVCRMLGYTGSSYVREASTVTDGTGKIFLDDVDCTGSESSLMYCKHLQWGHHNCQHGEDVGVICN